MAHLTEEFSMEKDVCQCCRKKIMQDLYHISKKLARDVITSEYWCAPCITRALTQKVEIILNEDIPVIDRPCICCGGITTHYHGQCSYCYSGNCSFCRGENKHPQPLQRLRWILAPYTTPSGKTQYLCTCCGRISVGPDKECPPRDVTGQGKRIDYFCSLWPYHSSHSLQKRYLTSMVLQVARTIERGANGK